MTYSFSEPKGGKSWNEIVQTMFQRRTSDAVLIAQMINTRDRYNGDIVIPLTDVEGEPQSAPLSPQVIHDGIEHTSMRAASVMPGLFVPALDPRKERGKRSREFAAIRRKALYASWDYNLMQLLLARTFRYLTGYGTFSMVVVPDFEERRARIELRNPLTTYPDPRAYEDYSPPENVGFVYGRSTAWCQEMFPEHKDLFARHPEGDALWDMVEWIDENDIVLGVLG